MSKSLVNYLIQSKIIKERRNYRPYLNDIKNNKRDPPQGYLYNTDTNTLIQDNQRNRNNKIVAQDNRTYNKIELPVDSSTQQDILQTLIFKYDLFGSSFYVRLLRDNRVEEAILYEPPTGIDYFDWWFSHNRDFFDGYAGEIIFETNDIIQLVPESKLTESNKTQYFREGITNCLLTPLKEFYTNYTKGSKAVLDYKKKVLPLIDQYMEEYKDGVPEDRIADLCQQLRIKVDIHDIFNNTILSESYTGRPNKVFKFMNTKVDHVDHFTNDTNIIDIDQEAYVDLFIELRNSDTFFTYTHSSISTIDTKYLVVDPIMDEVREWEYTNLFNDKMDYLAYPEMSEFVKQACHYGSFLKYDNDIPHNHLEHIDHEKSYYSYDKCHLYDQCQFPTPPSIYTQVPKDFDYTQYPGFYMIDNIKFDSVDSNIRQHLINLNIYKHRDVYSQPELIYMSELNITFDLIMGAFSYQKKSIDFSPAKQVYKKLAGKWASIRLDDEIYVNCNKEFADILFKSNKSIDFIEDTLTLTIPRAKVYHKSHLSSYILAYSRIQILTQLFQFPFNKVHSIQLDGIYFDSSADYKLIPGFREKPISVVLENLITSSNYISSYFHRRFNPHKWHPSYLHQHQYYLGPGGSGKTYNWIKENPHGFFTTPTNKLLREKRNEFPNLKTMTHARLTGMGKTPSNFIPTCICIDECTMLSKAKYNKIIKLYPNSRLVFCGDLDKDAIYQLPAYYKAIKKKGESDIDYYKRRDIEAIQNQFPTPPIDHIRTFTTNRRCIDPKLNKILNNLRTKIKAGYNKCYINTIMDKSVAHITFDKLKNDYDIEDYILAGTHKRIKEITDELNPHFEKKYLVTNTTKSHSIGDIIVGETKLTSVERRHAFSVHTCQGITVTTKLYIDSTSMFDPRMAYTALSRARTLDQVKLIM